ncbi:hypothetical protein [Phormidium tenue]|uniref:hypothetical protein n=1 Tax=Phormidium tenue TaxID=126344 RepID=UPI0030DD5C65
MTIHNCWTCASRSGQLCAIHPIEMLKRELMAPNDCEDWTEKKVSISEAIA